MTGFSQVPNAFNYQAIVRNASGEIVANQDVSFQISILEGSATGTVAYSETHLVTKSNFGLANLVIGSGTVVEGTLDASNWGTTSHFLKIEIDPDGGGSYTDMGTTQLLSVPYAFHAQTVEDDQVDDADADPANELQTLSLSGQDLTISDGNTITLPSDSLWKESGGDIYRATGQVGIGTDNPTQDLSIVKNKHASLGIHGTGGDYDAILYLDKGATSRYSTISFQDQSTYKFWVGLLTDNNFRISTSYSSLNGLEVEETGDVNLSDNLDVKGSTTLGASGVTFTEVREFTGTTGTGHFIEVSYPSGYTLTNTRVLSLDVFYNNSHWCSMGQWTGSTPGYNVSCSLKSDKILIYYPEEATMQNKPFRMILMKVE